MEIHIRGSTTSNTYDEEAGGLRDRYEYAPDSKKRGVRILSIAALCMGISCTLFYSMRYICKVGVSSSSGSDLAQEVASKGAPHRNLKQAPTTLCTNECDNASDFIAGIRANIPLPHDTINGKVPPGIPSGARSDIISSEWHQEELFAVYLVSGRQPGYRTPIHVHPRPQTVCILSGTVLNIVEGRNDTMYSAGDCYVMPAFTKMVTYNIGKVSYTDHDIFRVPAGETDWVVIEPGHLDLQDELTGRQVNASEHLDTASGESRESLAVYQYLAAFSATGFLCLATALSTPSLEDTSLTLT